jgi:4a-hydroxytetrahydrobiopterin dehydratase
MTLANKECVPCKGGIPPLERGASQALLEQLGGDWEIKSNGHDYLQKTYRFKDFREALAFVDRVGALAEEIGHHPDIYLAWGRVTLQVWTHKIKGLAESDFIFAAKCDTLVPSTSSGSFPSTHSGQAHSSR